MNASTASSINLYIPDGIWLMKCIKISSPDVDLSWEAELDGTW
jgi:hypothetical protein